MMIHDSCFASNNLNQPSNINASELRNGSELNASNIASDISSDISSSLPISDEKNCKKTLILGSNFDEDTFTQDELWTNIGINPTTLTEEIFLTNMKTILQTLKSSMIYI